MKRLALLFALIGLSQAQLPVLSLTEMAVRGVNFNKQLRHDMFFNSSVKESDFGVRYVVSTKGRPDLPEWLKVVQNRPTDPAYLYGTPMSVDDSTTVEITAIERNTNIFSQRTLEIKVSQVSDEARYFVDLTIRNLDLAEVFARDLLNDILVRMHQIWPESGNIYITKISALTEVGERLPVPETPGAENVLKDGVRIRVGGTGDFSNPLKRVEQEVRASCQTRNSDPKVSINDRFDPEFDVDWCKYRLVGVIFHSLSAHETCFFPIRRTLGL